MSLQPTRPVSVLMMLSLAVSACQDIPTVVHPVGPGGMAPNRNASKNAESASPYSCNLSTRDVDGPYPFAYRTVEVSFPKPALHESGETVLLRYVWTDPHGVPIAGANCRTPRTEMAVDMMDRRLGVAGRRRSGAMHKKREDGMMSTSSDPVCYTYSCPLPGLIVTPGPTYYNAPQPYDPYSKDPCWANCANGASQGTNDGNGYGWDPGPPSCDPQYDPSCYQPLNDADKELLGKTINGKLRPESEFSDPAAREMCEQLFTAWQSRYTGGKVFRGGTQTVDGDQGVGPHWGAYDENTGNIHFDPEGLDAAADGDDTAVREMMNTALHETAHALGFEHTDPVGPYYQEHPYTLLSPGSNSCIKW